MKNITLNDQICGHMDCLESFALRFTRNVEDANDLVQDTIIKAIRYHELYKPGTNLKGWLYTIMRNTFINDYRRGTKKNALIDTSEDLSSYQLHNSAERNQGENKFVMEDINNAMEQLPSDYAVPFLRYFEGYKYHEIAEELQIPIGTVKTRIFMARQSLKSQLKMYSDQFGKRQQSA
ncbi:putative extracytoplasmic function alternative sigma factor [Pedobacter sp. BAL39]|uniref:sigma-70 family RNA polymerase sigma factor n=1 Tax=Pedobacter sp. BAL39 TaxID=391596 RepID=UPI0001559E59|nr:sigma-70 family RNA polymerase sigma factor [Pedobacter sp. BAL39]EDM35526.1 putative extracytoplasmic function alternative sigma factor [Pedobacter sp. BAL39]